MAGMSAAQGQLVDTTGHLRAVIWFAAAAIVLLAVFLFRVETLQPNWVLLLMVSAIVFFSCLRAMRDLVQMKPASSKESIVQIGIAVITLLAVAAILYFSWRYGAPAVVRVVEAYVLPACVPAAFVYAALALRTEQKHKVRVFFGNRGWLFVPLPSNNTVEADARNGGARRSL
jgi:hypothetical protein